MVDRPPDPEDIPELDFSVVSRELIREVSTWKLEAKSEDNDRYFYHVREVSAIESGSKCYVIGRKGSGKTAISEYLSRSRRPHTYAEKLTFKSFPFNELYSLRNDGFTTPNQYITLWKYLIYSTICRLMSANPDIDEGVRTKLSELYGRDQRSLSRRINRWVSKDFSISLFGFSLTISGEERQQASDSSWIERVNVLEDVILDYIDDAKYFVVFDELDEDYRNIIESSQYEQYTALITSLFKAVQDVKSIFKDKKQYDINPVIFLRDDIYEIIQDSDKNKWNDFKIELTWDVEKVERILSFRISRAMDSEAAEMLQFEEAWSRLMGRQKVGIGFRQKKRVSSFEYIARSTYLRPRDFVKYLQACSEVAIERDGLITGAIIKLVDKAFSNYLKDELVDELFAIIPHIASVFDVISQIRKPIFSISEFGSAYKEQMLRARLEDDDPIFVLQILFLFSVVGNTPRPGFAVFRYTNKEARLNFKENLIVHRGLFKALQII